MNNSHRASAARSALNAFERVIHTETEDSVADLCTALMHLCHLHPQYGDFEEELARARRNFHHEQTNIQLSAQEEALKSALSALGSGPDVEQIIDVLQKPVLDKVADALVQDGYNPFDAHHGYRWFNAVEFEGAGWIRTLRQCLLQWKLDPACFGGDLPGKAAMRLILQKFNEGTGWDARNVADVRIDGAEPFDWLENKLRHITEGLPIPFEDTLDALNERVREISTQRWIDQAVESGIPNGVRTEFVYIPGWNDGDFDLDKAFDSVRLRFEGPHGTYLDELRPNDALRSFLQFINISTGSFVAAAVERNATEGQKLSDNLQGFTVEADHTRPSLIEPSQLLDVIENIGSRYAIPVIHAHIDVASLFNIDPGLPVMLDLPKHAVSIGFHDFVNGAGHMDTYTAGSTVTVDLLTGGFFGDQYSHGINQTYGLYLPPFYCEAQNAHADEAQSDEPPRRERQTG